MGHSILTLAALVLMSTSHAAPAPENYCQKLVSISGYKQDCRCGKGLKSSSLTGPKSLPLVAECGYFHQNDYPEGVSYFSGHLILAGEIMREESPSLGDTLEFGLTESTRGNFPAFLWSLRFGDEGFKKFRVPSLSENAPCWTAKATIVLKSAYVLEDAGTDFAGSFPIDYVVARVGKFKKCKPSY